MNSKKRSAERTGAQSVPVAYTASFSGVAVLSIIQVEKESKSVASVDFLSAFQVVKRLRPEKRTLKASEDACAPVRSAFFYSIHFSNAIFSAKGI